MTRRRRDPVPCAHPPEQRAVLELHPGYTLDGAPADPAARVLEAPFCTACGAVLSTDPAVLEAAS